MKTTSRVQRQTKKAESIAADKEAERAWGQQTYHERVVLDVELRQLDQQRRVLERDQVLVQRHGSVVHGRHEQPRCAPREQRPRAEIVELEPMSERCRTERAECAAGSRQQPQRKATIRNTQARHTAINGRRQQTSKAYRCRWRTTPARRTPRSRSWRTGPRRPRPSGRWAAARRPPRCGAEKRSKSEWERCGRWSRGMLWRSGQLDPSKHGESEEIRSHLVLLVTQAGTPVIWGPRAPALVRWYSLPTAKRISRVRGLSEQAG